MNLFSLVLLNIMSSTIRFLKTLLYSSLWLNIIKLYIHFFFHSSGDGHLGWFCFLIIINMKDGCAGAYVETSV